MDTVTLTTLFYLEYSALTTKKKKKDEAEVTSPVSLMEWHLNFYQKTNQIRPRPIEAICRAGEVMFVPNGWWHMVVNLEDSIGMSNISILYGIISCKHLLLVLL